MREKYSINARWAVKVLRTKNFIVLTDKESVIYFQGINPESINDAMELLSQQVELTIMRDKLDDIIKEHDQRINKLFKSEHDRARDIRVNKVRTTTKAKPKGKVPKRV